ncbi:MAG: AbrB/MazE/SpoVT family DNA-binding domain-containing protein, partial [Clostridia bacterium]|nr:AbrB/MazE/SpoVT family DNA-binding domain-containing protein [Clostridia bacterium]
MKTTGVSRCIDELGRIVIPKSMRNKLGIKNGDPLEFRLENGSIVITPDNWIFEPWTVEEYYQGRTYYDGEDFTDKLVQQFEDEAQRLLQIQQLLEPYGTHLF